MLFINDPKAHKDARRNDYDSGKYIYFGDEGNVQLKEKILNDIYTKFDEGMKNSTKFKQEIDWINSHFTQNGNDIIEIGKRSFNKIDFHAQEHYFPSAKKNKVGDESAIGADGRYDTEMQKSLQNGFLNRKVKPSSLDIQDMEM